MTSAPSSSPWWRGCTIYQIYPRSFMSGRGKESGCGDLRGIICKLEYIQRLGVDAIWISPFYKSPMKDAGYDVSDYRAIDPLFGEMCDFDELIREAHAHGLRVIIDLVLSHTSDQHEWFQDSVRCGDKKDWYVWADGKEEGDTLSTANASSTTGKSLPNNWLSIFGGPAWEWNEERQQYYLHNFLASQPDLNFHNELVQDAVLDVANFWLKKGVDGFRLDTINFYFHDKELRDNPILDEDKRNSTIAPEVNAYNHFDHLFDKSQPENIDFLMRLRSLMDGYEGDRAVVGEVGDAQHAMRIMREYTSGNGRAHMCYAFDFLGSSCALSALKVKEVIDSFTLECPDGWQMWAFSNHDVVRHATRLTDGNDHANHEQLKQLVALLLSMRGSACIYQGEELGLPEADIEYEDIKDPYGLAFWPSFKGRDGCRTPICWDSNETHAGGFFGGVQDTGDKIKPWLPIDIRHFKLAVNEAEAVEGSLLGFYRRFIQFRKQHPILSLGTIDHTEIVCDGRVFIMHRSLQQSSTTQESSRMCIAFNLSAESAAFTLPYQSTTVKSGFHNHRTSSSDGHEDSLGVNRCHLPPYGVEFCYF